MRHRLSRLARARTARRLGTLLATVLLAPTALALHAQGFVEIVPRPRPVPLPPTAVQVVSSTVTIAVTGREARVTVDDRLRNAGGAMAEASWLCPLPRDAAFGSFSLWNGEEELKGEMLDRDRAQAIYEEIVRRRRDPALLTLAGHGLVRSQVFPIAAGETRRVALRYVQFLERSGDALRLRYRLPIAEAQGRGPTTTAGVRRSVTVTLADANGYGEPYSPTHAIDVRRRGDRLEVVIDGSSGGDVELLLPQRRAVAAISVLAHRPAGEDGYAMLVLSPPATTTDRAPVARDVVLVVDVSGSMQGRKIEQARAGLLQALGSLNSRDRFRVITFSSAVREFRPGFTAATDDAVREARRFVEGLQADGGTNLDGALRVALPEQDGGGDAARRVPFVLVLTDGQPSVGESDPERLAARATARIGRARIFTIGVGEDVNTFLLDRLAQAGNGAAEYVPPTADVEAVMGATMRRLARPVLTDLRIVRAPVRLEQRQPGTLPDLFEGDEVVLLARYEGSGSGPLVVEGMRDGVRETIEVPVTFPASREGDDFVARLWATRRIGELTRTARLEGASDAIVREIRELGLRHGIITEYTAFLVQEPDRVVANGMPMPAAPMMDAQMRGGAAAARTQTGQLAMERAQASAAAMKVTTTAAAEQEADRRMRQIAAAAPAGRAAATQRAGGRLFVQRGAEWQDAAHRDSVPVVTIAPYSPAWFAVARALPEVGRCFGVGESVVVAGRQSSVRVAATGATELTPARLQALVRAFRGA